MSGTKERAAATARALSTARDMLASPHTDPDRVGDLVWWSAASTWHADADYAATVLAAHGIDPDATLPPPPDWLAAHGRAVLTCAAHARAQGYTLLDAAAGQDGERRTAIVRIARNGRVTTSDEGTIATARHGLSAPVVERAETAAAEKLAQAFVAEIRSNYQAYRADDMRIAVTTWLDLHSALLVRPGLYWLAPQAQPAVDAFDSAAQALGWGTLEAYEGRRSQPRSLRAARAVVVDGIRARLGALSVDVNTLTDPDAPRGPRGQRTSTLASRRGQIRHLASDVSLYASVTGTSVPGVDATLASLDSKIELALARGRNARAS